MANYEVARHYLVSFFLYITKYNVILTDRFDGQNYVNNKPEFHLKMTDRVTNNRIYTLSVWSCEVCQLRTGTGIDVSLTVISWQR